MFGSFGITGRIIGINRINEGQQGQQLVAAFLCARQSQGCAYYFGLYSRPQFCEALSRF